MFLFPFSICHTVYKTLNLDITWCLSICNKNLPLKWGLFYLALETKHLWLYFFQKAHLQSNKHFSLFFGKMYIWTTTQWIIINKEFCFNLPCMWCYYKHCQRLQEIDFAFFLLIAASLLLLHVSVCFHHPNLKWVSSFLTNLGLGF